MNKRFKTLTITSCMLLIFLATASYNVSASFTTAPKEKTIKINSLAYIALDANSKIVLEEKNSEIIVPMASTTKIITALVALNYGELDKKVEISSRAAAIGGSTVGYRKGEKITIRELIYGLMLRSGNDAAIALGEGISGSVEEFVKLMNEYATKIGLVDTHFHSPHGLDNPEHYSTAYDLAVLTAESKKHPLFDKIVREKEISAEKYGFTRSYHNINKILWQIPEANGVKTGFTGGAGKCLVTSVTLNGNDIVIVVLNSPERWSDTSKIFDLVKKNYEYKQFFSKGDKLGYAPEGKNKVNLVCDKDIILPVKKDKVYTSVIKPPKYIRHDIYKGDSIGTVFIFEEDKLVFKQPLKSDNYYKVGLIDKIMMLKKK